MTWVWILTASWLVVSCVAALTVARGLRRAELTGRLRQTGRIAVSYDPEESGPRRLAG